MLAWIVFLWFAFNYAFVARLVYLASRRSGARVSEAVGVSALWPRTILYRTASPI